MNTTDTSNDEQGTQDEAINFLVFVAVATGYADTQRAERIWRASLGQRSKRPKSTPKKRDAAKASRKKADDATIARQADIDAVARQSIVNAGVMLGQEEERRAKDAKIVSLSESHQQAEAEKVRIAAEVETIKNRFGLPHEQEEFLFGAMLEGAKANGYDGKEQNLVELLNNHEHGTTRKGREDLRKSGQDFAWTPQNKLCFYRDDFTLFLEKQSPKWKKKQM